jgi:hypothetical protein
MSDITKYELPPFLARRQRDENTFADAKAGCGSSAQPPHISIRDGRFTIVEADGTSFAPDVTKLPVIILKSNPVSSRLYYEKDFDPKAKDAPPPTCFSNNGKTPSPDVPENQRQSSTCDTCKWAVWGSARSSISGKNKPRCTTYKKVAVLVPDYRDKPYLLSLPPMTGKSWLDFVDWCEHGVEGRSVYPEDLLVHVNFISTGVMGFTPKTYISEEQAELRDKWIDSPEVRELLRLDERPLSVGHRPSHANVSSETLDQRLVREANEFKQPLTSNKPGVDIHYEPPGEPARMSGLQDALKAEMLRRRGE